MADFYYAKSESRKPQEILEVFSHKDYLSKGLRIYRNYDRECYQHNGNSAYIIGTAQVIGQEKESFLNSILDDFNDNLMPLIQKELIGQYIILINSNGKWYLQSDFMNIRPIFYDLETEEVSSNFGALTSFLSGFDSKYKSLEFKAMDKCLYPVMLGSDTSIKTIHRLQPCQYIVIDKQVEIKEFTITLDNQKKEPAAVCAENTLSLLSEIIRKYADYQAVSTITGGYDSRLISSICATNLPNLDLRISTIEEKEFIDLSIGKRVAKKLGKRLLVYKTNPEKEKEKYIRLTYGLSKENNLIVMSMVNHCSDYQIGFGGTMGTELFSTLPFHNRKQLVESFVATAHNNISKDAAFIQSFRQAIDDQLNYIESHILLQEKNPRDIVRLFWVFMTARFSSPLLALSDLYGHEMEPFATFPIIENGLQIPYHYQGDSKTFGRFYLIPKLIMKKVNYGVGAIESTHYQPLLPVSLFTLPHYIYGKLKNKLL